MGCDIHAFAEKRTGEKWEQLKNCFKQSWDKSLGDEIDLGRNYELFAFLANVRNDYDLKPISEPKGVPEDSSDGYRKEVEGWDVDGHSHSYFTLEELKNIPKELLDQEFEDEHLILSRDENGKITSTCAGTNRETLGKVGRRKLFGLWGNNPINNLIEELEAVKKDVKDDSEIRTVFFFDN
jgi:hypothetical protein